MTENMEFLVLLQCTGESINRYEHFGKITDGTKAFASDPAILLKRDVHTDSSKETYKNFHSGTIQ